MVITLDNWLLALGLMFLVVGRFILKRDAYQGLCQLLGTIWAQYSFVIAWSLAKLVPVFAIAYANQAPNDQLRRYAPLFLYLVSSTLLLAQFWEIPFGVNPIYGEYRYLVQIVGVLLSAVSVIAFARTFVTAHSVRVLSWYWAATVWIHAIASIYQYAAQRIGLPLIGVSRAHGLEAEYGVGDVAIFLSRAGEEIIRPGGLAGEPKTVGVIFAIYLLTTAYAPYKTNNSHEKFFGRLLFVAAFVGLLLTYSTSVLIGFVLAVVIISAMLSETKVLSVAAQVTVLIFAANLVFTTALGTDTRVEDLLSERTIGRFAEGQFLDGPVEAALAEMTSNYITLIFGTGMGGSSFITMAYLNTSFEFAYAPNILFVLVLIEGGLLGAFLMFAPMTRQVLETRRFAIATGDWTVRYLLVLAVGCGVLSMCGSAIPLWFSLTIGGLCAAAKIASSQSGVAAIEKTNAWEPPVFSKPTTHP
jgi:hypothetical protein